MLKHIVLFKLKDEAEGYSKQENALRMKQRLEELPGAIPQVVSFRVGLNISKSPVAYDLGVDSEFESAETLEIYRVHPKHVVVLEFINPLRESVAVVDYEF